MCIVTPPTPAPSGTHQRARLGTVCAQIDRAGDIVRKLLGHTRTMEPKLEPLSPDDLLAELR